VRYDGSATSRVLKIFFHDACFDGTASAALFAAFYRDAVDRTADVHPVGMIHSDGDPFAGVAFDADDHACVDFRFSADPKLHWWFDHHPTAFQPASLRDVFERVHAPTWFFDPTAPSCAGLIARTLAERWKWQPPAHLVETVAWADKIDAADFASAAEAAALTSPAQQLAAWLAHGRTAPDTTRYIDLVSRASLAEVAERPDIAPQLAAVADERGRELDAVKRLGAWRGDVVVFDRMDDVGARSPGFLGYLLFPTCSYTVTATRNATTIKITVGVNPWHDVPHAVDIGELCARYGGGGHAVVGGVTLHAAELPRARKTLEALVSELAKN
jgi:hypothetical protein